MYYWDGKFLDHTGYYLGLPNFPFLMIIVFLLLRLETVFPWTKLQACRTLFLEHNNSDNLISCFSECHFWLRVTGILKRKFLLDISLSCLKKALRPHSWLKGTILRVLWDPKPVPIILRRGWQGPPCRTCQKSILSLIWRH